MNPPWFLRSHRGVTPEAALFFVIFGPGAPAVFKATKGIRKVM